MPRLTQRRIAVSSASVGNTEVTDTGLALGKSGGARHRFRPPGNGEAPRERRGTRHQF
jgi:hypothetical protein